MSVLMPEQYVAIKEPLGAEVDLSGTGMRLTERWLAFLVLETAFLLAVQIVAGIESNSIALIADSAHSSVDLFAYGVNFYIERYKSTWASPMGSTELRNATRADLVGCIISTLMLGVATVWATKESLSRLLLPHDSEPETDFSDVGSAMLVFAVISTIANACTLIVYRYCFSKAEAVDENFAVNSPPTNEALAVQDKLPSPSDVPPPPPPLQNVPRPLVRRSDRQKRQIPKQPLNLRANFSMQDATSCAATGSSQHCASASCGKNCEASSSPALSLPAVIHQLFHPGCTSTHSHDDSHSAGADTLDSNLNVSSALLHLVADVLRGITMLVVAILIQANVIVKPGVADAVCALFVAAFVALGSLELFRRVFDHVCASRTNPDIELVGSLTCPEADYL